MAQQFNHSPLAVAEAVVVVETLAALEVLVEETLVVLEEVV
jgi:hypothetical protein